MIRSLLQRLSPNGERARLSILIFHRVLAAPDPLLPDEPDAARFDNLMQWVSTWFNVVPLPEAVHCLQVGTLPPRALCITFDDGYGDNARVALPILQRHRLTATFFVATGYLGTGRMWNDTVIESVRRATLDVLDVGEIGLAGLPLRTPEFRRTAIASILNAVRYQPDRERQAMVDSIARRVGVALPTDLMMTANEVRALHQAGMTIGAHTVTHPILARLDDDTARNEIANGRATLESIIDAPVTLFAYPNGKPGMDYEARHVELVRSMGFAAAVSTHWGSAQRQTSCFELPRFTPWDRTKWRFGIRMARNLMLQT